MLKGQSGADSAPAQAALRRLAARFLRRAADPDITAPIAVLHARSIALRLDTFDRALAIDAGPPASAIELDAIVKDLNAIDPRSTRDADAIDRSLRHALAPRVLPSAPMTGWPSVPAPKEPDAESPSPDAARQPPPALASWAGVCKLSEDTVAACAALDERFAMADRWPTYRASAAEFRRVLDLAGRTAVSSRPLWLDPQAANIIRVEFVTALTAIARRTEAESGTPPKEAIDSLRKLAALADLADTADRVDAVANGRSARAVKAAVSEAIAAGSWAEHADAARRLRTCEKHLRAVLRAAAPLSEKNLVRQARPLVGTLSPSARDASIQLLNVLPRTLRQADAMTDPAMLGAISVFERRTADLRAVAEISGALGATSEPDPAVKDAYDPVADKLLLLNQDLLNAKKRDAALTEFRELADQLRDMTAMPGEIELRAELQPRAAPGEWSVITGARHKALAAALDAARSRWLSERSTPKLAPSQLTLQRLALLRELIGVLRDAADALGTGAPDALQDWPGWELSPSAQAVLGAGLAEACTDAVNLAVDNRDTEAYRALTAIRSDYSAALLAGRLRRELRALASSIPSGEQAAALAQIALGPPPDSAWGLNVRHDLAKLCLLIERWSRLDAAAAPKPAADARAALNRLASQIRTRLKTDRD